MPNKSPASRSKSPAAEASATPRTGWARWRWSVGVACNLLATLILIYGGLTLGSHARWLWKSSGSPTAPTDHVAEVAGNSATGRQGVSHRIEAGSASLALRRDTIFGDREAIGEALIRSISHAAQQAPVPAHPAQPAEQRLLASLTDRQPAAVRPGEWKAFHQAGPIPLAVAISDPTGKDSDSPVRVLSWSLAMPVAERQWTLFTCQGSVAAAPSEDLTSVALPPDAHRGLSLTAGDGGQLVSFAGAGSLARWRDFFSAQLVPAEDSQDPWRQSDQRWHARFRDAAGRQIDVLLTEEAENCLNGLLVEMPAARQTRKRQTP